MTLTHYKGARSGKLTERTSILVCAIPLSTGYTPADAVDAELEDKQKQTSPPK
jgi:hypothetical protein